MHANTLLWPHPGRCRAAHWCDFARSSVALWLPVPGCRLCSLGGLRVVDSAHLGIERSSNPYWADASRVASAGVLLRHINPGAHGVDLLHADVTSRQQVTCHVLDTTRGRPATSLPVVLLRSEEGSRCACVERRLCGGTYTLVFMPWAQQTFHPVYALQ